LTMRKDEAATIQINPLKNWFCHKGLK
jgi:hypothetical protein